MKKKNHVNYKLTLTLIAQAIHARKILLDENTDKLLRNTSMAKKKEVNKYLRFIFHISQYTKKY